MSNRASTHVRSYALPRSSSRLSQQQFELYRLRAEENERNFLSLRSIEWQIPFQLYAACGAIAAGFFALKDYKAFGFSIQETAFASLVFLTLVFVATFFLQWQILRRLHFNRGMQQEYLKKLHAAVPSDVPVPPDLVKPSFNYWWAFVPMQFINLLVVASVATFILNATPTK